MTWKPIDLAPRDGSPIVVVFRSPLTGAVSASVAEWRSGGWERLGDSDNPESTSDVAFAWSELPEDLAIS